MPEVHDTTICTLISGQHRNPSHASFAWQIPGTQANTGDNHAISAMKFEILEEFLQLGWDVLLRYCSGRKVQVG